MNHRIRLTRDWVNPESQQEHKAGEIVDLPDYYFRLESSYGLQGGYTTQLEEPPAKPAPAKPAAPVKRGEPAATPEAHDISTNNDKE